ncbi:MAG: ATP synthase F0 subunit B [Lachnospiraceae bacterium]|nr:ATP synthase F0 subunit B [Lachnospiraceae bacterium]
MPLGIDFAQILLHLFNVVILFGGLYILLYAPVLDFMKKREDHYKGLEEEAERKMSEAMEKNAEYDEKMSKLDAELTAKRAEAEKELQQLRHDKEQEAKAQGAKILEKAEKTANEQRRLILQGAKDDVKKIVELATQKIVLENTQDANIDAFLEEAERGIADV